ncbi:unnamed protein product [Rhodiola kirilowii]
MGMGYEVIHTYEYGCVLYYKDFKNLEQCLMCHESRYLYGEGDRKIPRKVTPCDSEAWKEFDRKFLDFAQDARNVRLGLATDGFNPFGAAALSHSTWPIVLMPYNLPPSLCMKKEFNILAMLISGLKSLEKCLNVFMQPLIEELNMLWDTRALTFDRHSRSSFNMKVAVMWTITDFPGLGMLGGLKCKGYKACPLCLDEIDSQHLAGRMSYQGHRRWLDKDHSWRQMANKFNGEVELKDRYEGEVLLDSCEYFFRFALFGRIAQPYSLDMMHIEKNVFENIIGTILGLQGKIKDDVKAREGLEKQEIRKELWWKKKGSSSRKAKVSQAPYTVLPNEKAEILEFIKDAKYPYGYAGSLKNKINVEDKKFNGLKTHDCHVLLQRLLPVFIQPYLPHYVVEPLISLSRQFQKLCCKELMVRDVTQMKVDIIMILCKLEMVFPLAFFTITVHLLIHLPEQVLLKGPVHYNWMYPI